MARYPGAQYRPLGTQTEPPMRAHNILCFHTMVGSLRGTDSYFRDRGFYGVESHFGVGNDTDGSLDGAVYQWQDTAFAADANYDGKPEVISIETADGANPNDPWSPKALDALVELGIWVCKTHNIPPVLIPDTQPGRRGIGYHRMGCDHSSSYRPRGWPYDKWREPGGVKWSTVLGKTCPGDVRIKQLVDIVIPRIKAGVEGKEDDDMSAEDVRNIRDDIQSLRALVSGPNLDYTIDGEEKTGSLRTTVAYTRQDIRTVLRVVQGLAEAINAEALAADVAEQINRLDAEDVVDAFAERLEGTPS